MGLVYVPPKRLPSLKITPTLPRLSPLNQQSFFRRLISDAQPIEHLLFIKNFDDTEENLNMQMFVLWI